MTDPSGYYRPMLCADSVKPDDALWFQGGPLWFSRCVRLDRGRAPCFVEPEQVPADVLLRFTSRPVPICGLALDRTRIMGVLNVTPDSFSDGGRYDTTERAVAHAAEMVSEGADILDIGGESTRPGADTVPADVEIERVVPVIEALRSGGITAPISVDTRKSVVARAAVAAGADLLNDVTALTYDSDSLATAAELEVPVCLMHAAGDPKTMQEKPSYGDVVLEVLDYLDTRVRAAENAGIPRVRILVDPGIGFGKTLDHNLALLNNLAVFHGLGCPVLLGVSRKRFIGTLADEPVAGRRAPGSIAAGLAGVRQGVQMLRVHDISETRQALAVAARLTA